MPINISYGICTNTPCSFKNGERKTNIVTIRNIVRAKNQANSIPSQSVRKARSIVEQTEKKINNLSLYAIALLILPFEV